MVAPQKLLSNTLGKNTFLVPEVSPKIANGPSPKFSHRMVLIVLK